MAECSKRAGMPACSHFNLTLFTTVQF